MRTLLLTLSLPLLICASTSAQSVTPAETEELQIIQQVLGTTNTAPVGTQEALGIISKEFGLSAQEASLLQSYSTTTQGNLAVLRQEGNDNDAFLRQSSNGNVGVILHLGDANRTSAVQDGSNNVLGVRLRGDNNQLGTALEPGVIQEGDDNVYLLDLNSSDQHIAPTVQQGVGNEVVQTGSIPVPFGVQQYGNGLRLIIHHNGVQ